ncbi:hypothetical protein IRB23SM22_23360 [Alkalibacterium sp. s-m-22]
MTNILPEKSENHEVESTVSHFFKEFKIGTLLNRANVKKLAVLVLWYSFSSCLL